MKCISTRILISVLEDENQTNELGLVLPSTLKNEGIERAKVLYVGEEVKTKINEGSEIFIYRGAGSSFTNPEDGKKYRVITDSEIIVIYE